MPPRWLTQAMVLALHHESHAMFGGSAGVRDLGLLQSALARPQHLLAYEPDTDLAGLAAAYGFGLSRSHPFVDGNKRIALVAIGVFLAINGLRFDPDQADEVRVMLALAQGELDEPALAAWIRDNLKPESA